MHQRQCREKNGLALDNEAIRYAWQADYREARRRVEDQARMVSKALDFDAELNDLFANVGDRLNEPWAWDAVSRIANRLCDEGAISGQLAKALFEQSKCTHTSPE
jgi:hypothetical protein